MYDDFKFPRIIDVSLYDCTNNYQCRNVKIDREDNYQRHLLYKLLGILDDLDKRQEQIKKIKE